PFATVSEAVEASCAIPGIIAPTVIGHREYVDGGAWSPSNLDAAPAHRGTQILCLNPLSTAPQDGGFIRNFARSALAVESLAQRNRGADVLSVAPDPASVAAIGPDLRDRGRRAGALAAGYQQGRALAGARAVVRA